MRKNFFLSLLFAMVMAIPFVLWADEIHDAAKSGNLFFISNRNGNNDVYWVDTGFIKEQKDKEMKDDFPVLKGPCLGQEPPGLVPKIFAPGIVSLENTLENGCAFSKDLTEFYFTREDRSKGNCWIFVSRLIDGRWTPPEVVPFSGRQFTDFEPHISPDGKTLFFVRMHPTDQGFKNGLWFTRRTDTGWSEPQFFRLGMFASLTNDNSIYYTNLMQEKGQPDIVMSKFVNGSFSEPQPVSGGVDSPYLDAHPCIDPDERFIIFDSRRASVGKGNFDLHVCFRQADGSWSEAFPLGERLGRGIKMCASISPDGKYLFFTLFVDNNADIYWVDAKIIEELKPGEVGY
jgi:hypothetical protein